MLHMKWIDYVIPLWITIQCIVCIQVFMVMLYIIYAYRIPTSSWFSIPGCPQKGGFAIAIVDGLLTAIGGYKPDDKNTNKLFSLTGEGRDGKWIEKLPLVPTKRSYIATLCTEAALVVAGGVDDNHQKLKTVEILDTEIRQWHTAPDLPEPLSESSLILRGELIYLMGGYNENKVGTCF